jgi:hypothetical protein
LCRARLVFALLTGVLRLAGQTSGLQGSITDQHAAVILTVVISVANQEATATRKTMSTDVGAYSLPQLPPRFVDAGVAESLIPNLHSKELQRNRSGSRSERP